MNDQPHLRVLDDPPRDGAWNMAADEVLLEGAVAGRLSLRLYAWSPPAWSLGRGQPYEDAVDERFCRERGVDVVRRPTGGLGVLHDREVTYALAGPSGRGPFAGPPRETYRKIGEALEEALRALGARVARVPAAGERAAARPDGPFCAAMGSIEEIVSADGGGKIVGSAQRRRRGGWLQHGSIPLAFDERLQTGVAGRPGPAPVPLDVACGRKVGPDEVRAALVRAISDASSLPVRREGPEGPGRWTSDELARIEALRAWKYLDRGWTRSGREPSARAEAS